jgi:transcriptional/translational regulatory protein YebC/TACO1
VTEANIVRQVLKLMEVLDDLEDVKAVHANYDIDDSLLTSAEN